MEELSAFAVLQKRREKSNLKQIAKSNAKKNINESALNNNSKKLESFKIKKKKPVKDQMISKNKTNSKVLTNKKLKKIANHYIHEEQNSNSSLTLKNIDFNQIYKEAVTSDTTNPIQEGKKLFEWMIFPFKSQDFFKKNWESNPLIIRRNKGKYYKILMSTPLLDKILRENYLLFTKNVDVTSFSNDTRETHNPPGRALPSIVWDYYLNGCSVRLLNPQTYIPKLHTLNATLQEFFGCFVGANSYLTPPNSQGFAPHYDDIEAFILQIEGKKRWKLYKPRDENEYLPRYSSPNFSQKDLSEPVLEAVLNAGDLLYFPRGFIHQGDTIGFKEHSLHITISIYQRNSWGDFLETLLPTALKSAIENNVQFRQGLPLNFGNYIGAVHSDESTCAKRQEFIDKTKGLLSSLINKYIDIDKAADDVIKNHIHDFLPPVLNDNENLCSVYEGGETMIENGNVVNRIEIEPDTFIRLTRSHCVRLVKEDDTYRIYYSCENSKEYHEYELQFLEVDAEFIPAIKMIIKKYPQYVRVEDLPINELDKKIQIVQDLWEKGILISKEPLPIVE